MDHFPLDIIGEICKYLNLNEICNIIKTNKLHEQIFCKTDGYRDFKKLCNNKPFEYEPNINALIYYTDNIKNEIVKCYDVNEKYFNMPKTLKYNLHYIVKIFCIYNNDFTYDIFKNLSIELITRRYVKRCKDIMNVILTTICKYSKNTDLLLRFGTLLTDYSVLHTGIIKWCTNHDIFKSMITTNVVSFTKKHNTRTFHESKNIELLKFIIESKLPIIEPIIELLFNSPSYYLPPNYYITHCK
jgi:hypothetical protein